MQSSAPAHYPDRAYTAEEYFALDAASPIRLEMINGRIRPHGDDAHRLLAAGSSPEAMAGASKSHNLIIGNMRYALDDFLRRAKNGRAGCEVYAESVRVETNASTSTYSYPDVVLTCDEQLDDHLTVRQPAVIFEVLSPSTSLFDRGIKFDAYRTVPSLDQIIFIEPRWASIDSYTRNAGAQTWTLTALRKLTDELLIRTIDVRIPLADIYDRVRLSDLRLDDSV